MHYFEKCTLAFCNHIVKIDRDIKEILDECKAWLYKISNFFPQ